MLELYKQFNKRRSYRNATVEEARLAHENGDEHLLHGQLGSVYVGDFVFGGIDGVITTFAVVAGVTGAHLSTSIVLVLGLANLLADGFAMGIGNYLSIKSDHERFDDEREKEKWEIENIPDHERQEVKDIFRKKGFEGVVLEGIVETITADKERWIDTMMTEELGLSNDPRSALKGGLVTYFSFILIGFIPLLSFVLAFFLPAISLYTFPISVGLTALALFFVGALKTVVLFRSIWLSGFETLLMGGLAAIVAYVVGYILKGLA